MTLVDVIANFSTNDRCRELLTRLRWPNGPECLRCHGKVVELETKTKKVLFYCAECDYQFSVTVGTVFNDTHLPLTKWFLATLLLVESRKGFSANELKRVIGVSYKTAWYLFHRIRAAMKEADQPLLTGTVEVDETFVGGKAPMDKKYDNKSVVIGLRQRGGALRFFHAADIKSGTLAKYIKENVSADVDVIVTDEYSGYPKAMIEAGFHGSLHKTIRHKDKIYVEGEVHTNTVESAFSLLKRGLMGTWHRLSAKHLSAYLDEMTFRFNRRDSDVLFLDTLRHMVTAPTLTFENLISDNQAAA